MVGIEGLAVDVVGQNDLLRLELGRYFGECQYRAIAVSTENHDRLRERPDQILHSLSP